MMHLCQKISGVDGVLCLDDARVPRVFQFPRNPISPFSIAVVVADEEVDRLFFHDDNSYSSGGHSTRPR